MAEKKEILALYQSVREGDIEKIKLLLDKGINVNTKDKEGWTPLHWATKNKHTELALLLIKKDAYVTTRDKFGARPIDFALEYNNEILISEMMSRLISEEEKIFEII